MSYEAVHPRTGRVLLQGPTECLVYQPRGDRPLCVHATSAPPPSVLPSLLIVQAADGSAPESPRGTLPSDDEVASWADDFDWVVVMHHHLYADHEDGSPNSAPPYTPLAVGELVRFNAACLGNGIWSLAYISPFDYRRTGRAAWHSFYTYAQDLLITYGYRGFYVDGLLFDYGQHEYDDPWQSLEIARRLNEIVGPGGVLVGHLSHGNQPAAFLPNVEELFDAVLKGEGYTPSSLDDPYLVHEIATTRWTGRPVGWLYHKQWPQMQDWTTLEDLMAWQVAQGMMGVSYAQMREVDGRTTWSDGMTSYYSAWKRALESRT